MNAALITLQLVVSLTMGQYAPQRLAGDPLDPAREARVQVLAKQLRCAVCQGLSISDSPSSMARAQLEMVRELVSEGKSDEEVVEYFVARYGDWVLLEPPASGINLLVWAGPLVLVALGLLLILRQLGPGSAASAAPDPGSGETAAAVAAAPSDDDDPYLKAVREET